MSKKLDSIKLLKSLEQMQSEQAVNKHLILGKIVSELSCNFKDILFDKLLLSIISCEFLSDSVSLSVPTKFQPYSLLPKSG